MAFAIYSTDDGRVPGTEYLPCDAITPQAGMLLKMEGGFLKAATGADTPAYFSMAQRKSACTQGELLPVFPLQRDILLLGEKPEGFSLKAGETAQLSADGTALTTTAGGAAELVTVGEEYITFRVKV